MSINQSIINQLEVIVNATNDELKAIKKLNALKHDRYEEERKFSCLSTILNEILFDVKNASNTDREFFHHLSSAQANVWGIEDRPHLIGTVYFKAYRVESMYILLDLLKSVSC